MLWNTIETLNTPSLQQNEAVDWCNDIHPNYQHL